MKVPQGRQPIFWMVRLLGAIGFVMAVLMIGQTGLQLQSIRADRLRLEEQQEHLSQARREIIRRAEEAHGEIQAALDENSPFRGKPGAVHSLEQVVRQLSQSTNDATRAIRMQEQSSDQALTRILPSTLSPSPPTRCRAIARSV
jgi:hypothetical protein